jgi:hypothetical protein
MRYRLAFLLTLVLVSTAFGMVPTPVFELAQKCNVAFTGTITAIDTDTATIRIDQLLLGKVDGPTVVVAPSTQPTDVGRYLACRAGDIVLIYGTQNPGKPVTVLGGGEAMFKLDPARRQDVTGAAKRLLEIVSLREPEEKEKAMLAAAGGDNPQLRAIAQDFVRRNIDSEARVAKYKKEFSALLGSDVPDEQRTALDTMRFVTGPENLPRIIGLTHSKDIGVVESASLALGRYDTAESQAALIALTKDENPQVRIRAAIDLSESRRAGAKEALAILLTDKAASVRAIAPRGLVFLLRDGKANDLIPNVAALLSDTDDAVCIAAAQALSEPRDTAAITPLLDALENPKIGHELAYFTLQSLYSHYTKDGDAAKALIDKRINSIIAALRADTSQGGMGAGFQAISILSACGLPEAHAAIDWAAASHPNSDVRAYAKQFIK